MDDALHCCQGLIKASISFGWLPGLIQSWNAFWEPGENISISEDTGNKSNDHKKQSLNKESLKI